MFGQYLRAFSLKNQVWEKLPDRPGGQEIQSFQVFVPRVDFHLLGVQDVLDQEQGQLSRGSRAIIERAIETEWPAQPEPEVPMNYVSRQVCHAIGSGTDRNSRNRPRTLSGIIGHLFL